MSIEIHVIFVRSKTPSVESWQSAIDRNGFDVQLDPELVPAESEGFVPTKIGRRESGFEFDIGEVSELADAYPQISARAKGLDVVGNFRWGGDLNELTCVLAVAASLTQITGGIVFDPQEDVIRDAVAAIEWAKSEICSIEAES